MITIEFTTFKHSDHPLRIIAIKQYHILSEKMKATVNAIWRFQYSFLGLTLYLAQLFSKILRRNVFTWGKLSEILFLLEILLFLLAFSFISFSILFVISTLRNTSPWNITAYRTFFVFHTFWRQLLRIRD